MGNIEYTVRFTDYEWNAETQTWDDVPVLYLVDIEIDGDDITVVGAKPEPTAEDWEAIRDECSGLNWEERILAEYEEALRDWHNESKYQYEKEAGLRF